MKENSFSYEKLIECGKGILFGKGKISSIMGDLAKGIKSFKKGMSDDNSSKNEDSNNSDGPNSDNK